MTTEQAFDIFCDECHVTDPILRELQLKPVFFTAWRMAEQNMLQRQQSTNDPEECCGNCDSFTDEDIDGHGFCTKFRTPRYCDEGFGCKGWQEKDDN